MASSAGEVFTKWLNTKLRELNTDETVFSSYIVGILEGDEPIEEKHEALDETLSQIVVSNVCCFCLCQLFFHPRFQLNAQNCICSHKKQQESDIESILKDILDHWESSRPKIEEVKRDYEDVDVKLTKLLESKSIAKVQRHQHTAEEQKIREQILAQYSQVELDECEDDQDDGVTITGGKGGSSSDPTMAKNTNAADVAQLAKERREQAKLDSKAKKDKDKEDRYLIESLL